jgi:hypothetical protein
LIRAWAEFTPLVTAISEFHQDDPQHCGKIEDFKVQHAVHSLVVDPETHRVYIPEQEENEKPEF